jgi:hypothetical protein
MFTLIRAARAMAIGCLCGVTFFAVAVSANADPTDNQANNDKLFGLLSGGYSANECHAGNLNPADPFLSRISCGPSSRPGGPTGATYSLYGNTADLNKTFNVYVNSGAALLCPGTTNPGPTAWQGGMVYCATAPYPSGNAHMVAWTKTADLMVASVTARDLDPLYAWWFTAR